MEAMVQLRATRVNYLDQPLRGRGEDKKEYENNCLTT